MYDRLNRLTQGFYEDPANGRDIIGYAYDADGNRLTMKADAGTTSYVYDAADRLTSVTEPGQTAESYTWDDNGNLTARGSGTFRWDAENRLLSINGSTAYSYNGDGLRASAVWDVNRGIPQELDDGWGKYVYGVGRISQQAAFGAGTATYHYLADGLGSTLDFGSEYTYYYEPFGLEQFGMSVEGITNHFHFVGERQDASGLYYLRARYYDPATGRFISKDAFDGNSAFPNMQNRYVYVLNEPLNLTDPSGLECIPICNIHLPDPVGVIVKHLAGGNVSTAIQRADLLPWGAIPGVNILTTAVSWPLDVTAFALAAKDIVQSSCSFKEKVGLMFNNSINLGVGLGGQALAAGASATIVGPPIISGLTSAVETTLYIANELAVRKCDQKLVSEVKSITYSKE